MRRRILCAALIMGMALSMAACGQKDGSTAGETTEAETTGAPETTEDSTAGEEETTPAVSIAELPEYTAADYVSLDSYTGMEVQVADGTVTEEEYQQLLNQFLQSRGSYTEITDRKTAEGDTINFNYSGAVDGVQFQGGTATNQTTTLGKGGWIEGFEEGLIGKPCGEEFVIDAYFPDPYKNNMDLSGKIAQFTVTINYIQGELVVPELTDEFVKGLEDYTCATVEEFETVFKDQLTQQKTSYMENQAMNAMWIGLLEKASFNGYPEGYVDAYMQDAMASYTAQAAMYGLSLEDYVKAMSGYDMETFAGFLREDVEAMVKDEILYNYIADRENLVVTEEEYLSMVQTYMDNVGYDDMTAFVNAYGVENVERQGYADALFEKVLHFCYDSAVKVPAETETAPQETTAAQ
ncbi:MAG: trigger factor [Lachnospiraceae bacterium]|jgi:trigger factor|nr:trigger factor [Lachnospiraceae bacterium]